MVDDSKSGTMPPGFSPEEWAQAIADGRVIVRDRPVCRRPPRALRPAAACWWFCGLVVRSLAGRLARRAGFAGAHTDAIICESGDIQASVDSVDKHV
jgi:hypothetical protein